LLYVLPAASFNERNCPEGGNDDEEQKSLLGSLRTLAHQNTM
jgi:hypothetical protein